MAALPAMAPATPTAPRAKKRATRSRRRDRVVQGPAHEHVWLVLEARANGSVVECACGVRSWSPVNAQFAMNVAEERARSSCGPSFASHPWAGGGQGAMDPDGSSGLRIVHCPRCGMLSHARA